jgi:hypothetical protein
LEWEIRDKDNNIINSEQIKLSLEEVWEENIGKLIENYYSRNIENNWNIFLHYINNELLLKKSWMVSGKQKDYFLEFIAIQLCRRTENLKKFGLDLAVGIFVDIMIELIPEDFLRETIDSNDYKEDLFLIQLYKYVKYRQTKDINYENNSITKIIDLLDKQIQICFLQAPSNVDFITSDNPCIHIPLGSMQLNYFSGIYLPINKKLCAFLCKNREGFTLNKYLIMDISNQNVTFINHIIVQNCISKIAYDKPSVSNLIQISPDINGWVEMFAKVKLEYVNA